MKTPLLLLMMLVFSGNAAAAMYKWVDEDGNVHYTQTPPPADVRQAETIKPPPDVNTDKARKDLEQEQELVDKIREQRLETKEEERLAQKEREQKEANCKMARDRLASYTQPRVRYTGEDGNRYYFTEEERQEQIQKSKDMIDEFCN